MPFRTSNHLNTLIVGTAEEVAMAICFWSREDRDEGDDRDWYTQVLPEIRASLGLPPSASWQHISHVNNTKLARELGLPENTPYHEIVAADNRRLATLMGIHPSTPYHELYRKAVSLCATYLGLHPSASWEKVYQAYIDQQG